MNAPKAKVALHLEGVSKSFFGVRAVEDVSFTLTEGKLLGLIGENGAGKSTLMNILGGVITADQGTMTIAGRPYLPRSPRDAVRAGIAFIHQELNLFTNLSIAENLFLSGFPRHAGLPLLDRRTMQRRTQEALKTVSLEVSPNTRVEALTPGERQLVEIAKAINARADIIIFDEPTTSLTERETERLFRMLGTLRAGGTSVIYISHILTDVQRLADEVMIMRDGKRVAGGEKTDFDTKRMISLMVGRDLERLYPEGTHEVKAEQVLAVNGLSQPGILHEVSFELSRGEVLGLFGLMGSGRSELARTLFGLDPYTQGSITVLGTPLREHSPRGAIAAGVAFVTENRREEGLMMDASIAENMSLVSITEYAQASPFLDTSRLNKQVAQLGNELRLKTSSYTQPVKTLSGGNQQKVVLGKWLSANPQVFIVDEPTRGVDVGAKFEVYALVQKLAEGGAGVLFISSELEELVNLCDRILVMHNGEIVGHFIKQDFDKERILASAFKETA